jgi:hypothetical protein
MPPMSMDPMLWTRCLCPRCLWTRCYGPDVYAPDVYGPDVYGPDAMDPMSMPPMYMDPMSMDPMLWTRCLCPRCLCPRCLWRISSHHDCDPITQRYTISLRLNDNQMRYDERYIQTKKQKNIRNKMGYSESKGPCFNYLTPKQQSGLDELPCRSYIQ